MRRLFIPLVLLAAAALGVSCESWNDGAPGSGGSQVTVDGKVTHVYFGPVNEDRMKDYTGSVRKKHRENPDIVDLSALTDSVTFLMMASPAESEYSSGAGLDVSDMYNRIAYDSGGRRFFVKWFPENLSVTGFQVKSSADSVIAVSGYGLNYVDLDLKKSGECSLTLRIKTLTDMVELVYIVRVVNAIELDFYITPYWLAPKKTPAGIALARNTRIRWKAKGVADRESIMCRMRDSVTVIGYCEYYDYVLHGREPIVKRDTATFQMRTHHVFLLPGVRWTLRNISNAVMYYRYFKVETGRRFDGLSIIPCWHHYYVEQVIVNYEIISEGNLYEFNQVLKVGGKRTNHNWVTCEVEDEEPDPYAEIEYDEDDETEDDLEDGGDEDPDDVSELKMEEIKFFTVSPYDFLNQHQRDSVGAVASAYKNKHNVSSTLSKTEADAITSMIDEKEGNNLSKRDSMIVRIKEKEKDKD